MKIKILPLSLFLAYGAAVAADEQPADKVVPKVEVKGSAAMDAPRNDTATKIVVTQEVADHHDTAASSTPGSALRNSAI